MTKPPADAKLASRDEYVAKVRDGDRAMLGRAITLIESERADHRALARDVLQALLPLTGGARRVGISGVPGVGKSTFIEALGTNLTETGHRVAVLAVDPSSALTGGSILGDKTRMTRLANDPNAFIRPSPSSGELGGITRRTRETMLLCEAAGYDVVIVETVGVGQSETAVAEIVDFFVLLALPGAGDDLQGIKRGILELADLVAINKADGDQLPAAERARHQTQLALRILRDGDRAPPVLLVSALENRGLDQLWTIVEARLAEAEASGALPARRAEQELAWMWTLIRSELVHAFTTSPEVAGVLAGVEDEVRRGVLTSAKAAERLLAVFFGRS